jgi:hypothetical protein
MMCWFCHKNRPIRRLQDCNESIPDSSDRLYKSRALGIIIEDLPDFAYGGVDPVVHIHKNALAPYPVGDRFPGYDFAVLLNQHQQDLQRNALELDGPPTAAKLKGRSIQLTVPEADRSLRDADTPYSHGNLSSERDIFYSDSHNRPTISFRAAAYSYRSIQM